ncbi:MAG: lipid-A-disaccharide synthase-related protein [Microcystaceae cyanobacterium]
MKLLFLSNGHGEDLIATRIIEKIQKISDSPQITALPIVGEGHAYQKLKIPLIATAQKMPSGGFIYQDRRELWRDIQGGLLQLTLNQFKAVRQWGQEGGKIVAVGDIVPLFMAWFSGGEYSFVGTAKSEYYIQDEKKWLKKHLSLEFIFGSIYFPWERWLMKDDRCCAVFPRDPLTAKVLQNKSIPSYDLGNPMMDEIDQGMLPISTPFSPHLTILLLPGSRSPEAQRNWELILMGVDNIIQQFTDKSLVFLAAIAPSLSLPSFQDILFAQGWQTTSANGLEFPLTMTQVNIWEKNKAKLILSQQNYANFLQLSHVGLAMAGTATEQFVGLGKPVFTFPGLGPQFIYRFAEAQTRLLGKSVILLEHPQQVGQAMGNLLNNSLELEEIATNGQIRMGKSGASQRIAQCLLNIW